MKRIVGAMTVVAAVAAFMSAGPVAQADSGDVTPMSSSGESGNVQIEVKGSGLHVDWVLTQIDDVKVEFPPCNLDARLTFYFANNAGYEIYYDWHDPSICDGGRIWMSQWDTTWPNNTKVCATWYNLNGTRYGGEPCETIHK